MTGYIITYYAQSQTNTKVVVSSRENLMKALMQLLKDTFSSNEDELYKHLSFTAQGLTHGTFKFMEITGTFQICEAITC